VKIDDIRTRLCEIWWMILVRTDEDWYPNFNRLGVPNRRGRYVRLSLWGGGDRDFYRVDIWGADDTGMEMDFRPGELEAAKELFCLIRDGGSVTRNGLASLGLHPT